MSRNCHGNLLFFIDQTYFMTCFYSRSTHLFTTTFFLLALVFISASTAFAGDEGAKIFKQNCSRCHTIGKGASTGPDLKDVITRVPNEEWMHKWIWNNKKLRESGDSYANQVWTKNEKKSMDVFEGILNDDDINAVIAYVKNPPVIPTETTTIANHGPAQEPGISTFTILVFAFIILLILVPVLGSVKRSLQDSVNAKKGLPPAEHIGVYTWIRHHKKMSVLITIILGAVCVRAIYIGVMNIGVYESYKPEQPIKFSHQVHAGKLEINCVYCHSGAEKGRTAGVPSANVCMNCHKAIKEGPLTGKVEIAKIYEAVGWNPEKQKYDKPQHPIVWNRVHALPDFAYFNHSQHVVVGKQECKTCHGAMDSTDVASQHSPLTMGWCVDCHRKTEVPGMSTNPYYSELHEKLKKKYEGQPITVEKMGGLDCIKCHY